MLRPAGISWIMRRNWAAPSTRCPLISATTSFSLRPALAAGLSGTIFPKTTPRSAESFSSLALPAVTSWVSTPSQLEPSSPKTIFRSSVSIPGRTSICVGSCLSIMTVCPDSSSASILCCKRAIVEASVFCVLAELPGRAISTSPRAAAPPIVSKFRLFISSHPPRRLDAANGKASDDRPQNDHPNPAIHGAQMNRSAAVPQFAMHLPGPLGTLHHNRELGKEVSIQAASFDIRLQVGRHGQYQRAVRRFSGCAGLVRKMRQLQVDVPVGGVSMNAPASFKHFDITVYRVQVFHGFNTGNAQRTVHRADMLEARAVRNVDGIFHRYFHALVLRIASGDRDGVRLGLNLDGNTFKIGLLVFRGLYCVDFDLVTVPPLHVHSSVDVLQLNGTAGLQRIGLIELLADGKTGNGPNNG